VLVACAGCAEFGSTAHDVALLLDRRGFGELAWLGASARLDTVRAKAKGRYPVFCIDACGKGCAREWAAREGVTPQHCIVLTQAEREDPDRAASRIAGVP